jgi:AraC-like DNA-binding protein
MLAHNDTIWDMEEALTLSPSVLYHLEPLGMGTPYIESLTSFLKRLAHLHHLTIANLVTFCSEQTSEKVMPSAIHKLFWIDSITQSGRMWSQLLARLTGCPQVVYLTMAYWECLLNPYQLLRERQAWCPVCYAEWLNTDKPIYEPLLWRLQRVDTCPIHQRKLEDVCPGCGQQFPSVTSNGAVGYCPRCQTWLGDEALNNRPVTITSESYQLSQTVGELLALAPQVGYLNERLIPQVIETIHHQRRMPYTHITDALHISMTAFTPIKSGERLPNLNTLTRLAILSEGMLWKALAGQSTLVPQSCSNESVLLETTEQKQRYLEELLASSDPLPALLHITRTCGFSWTSSLQKAFPSQYDKLRIRIYDEQRQALQDVLDGNAIITVIELARQRGYYQTVLFSRFPELCRQVTHAYHERKLNHCRQYLRELIQTNCFPYLIDISKTLEVGSYYLTQHFPEEVAFIETQRQRHCQQQAQEVQEYLEAALTTDVLPPLSLDQIAAELGKSVKTLKRVFPMHAQKILEKRRKYLADQLELTCRKIRQTVFDLHQQGIYPSVDRIHAVIGSWMVHGSAYRNAYIEAMTTCGYVV